MDYVNKRGKSVLVVFTQKTVTLLLFFGWWGGIKTSRKFSFAGWIELNQTKICSFCIIHESHILFVHAKINTYHVSRSSRLLNVGSDRRMLPRPEVSHFNTHKKRMCAMKPLREAWWDIQRAYKDASYRVLAAAEGSPFCGGRENCVLWASLTRNCFFQGPSYRLSQPLLNRQPQGLLYIHDINAAHT